MDPYNYRKDFPLFDGEKEDGIIYFDNACMTLRPRPVIDKIVEYYSEYPGCGGRSLHKISSRVTEEFEGARETIAKFINAPDPNGVIFTKNTTESINLVSNSFPFENGDKVIGTDHEHNSNLVPWVYLKKKGKIEYEVVPSNEDNSFNIENFKEKIKGTKLVSMVHVSNLDGTQIPEKEIIEIAHDSGAFVMLDCAQSVPHLPIDMKDMDVDLLVFSGHKVCGPTGTGVLAGKKEVIDQLDAFIIGGDTVMETTYSDVYFLSPPKKFEAGLQNYSGFIGLGAALKYVSNVGIENIHEHEIYLNNYATDLLKDKVTIFGSHDPDKRGGIFPFKVDGFNSHDISLMLDELAQIETRSGRHCVHSWFNDRNVDVFARASFYLYNTKEEIKLFAEILGSIIDEFQ